ncbi:MAG TPA: FAD-dependent oxidoreductase, partial [Vicinamibacterales bacterium]|nr:FAD-dependent oxidoreductase [Vicinamibacterales bacterium]
VIVGGGPAGLAAAQMLRREGYDGAITMISADDSPPADRPNLSKEFLAGDAKDEWIPLRPDEFYRDERIDLQLRTRVTSIDPQARHVTLDGGRQLAYGALLIATGAAPVRLDVPGVEAGHVRYLRSFSDSKAIVDLAGAGKRVVVIGASFIGLEVAASLRARQLEVDVVAPDSLPLEKVMGPEIGRMIRALHEAQGVRFHLGQTVARLDGRTVTLSSGAVLDADFVVAGIGVRPVLDIAEKAGLTIDRGIAVDEFLETSAPGIFAAGDVARWPDPHTGDRIRVEHFVVAERQGQAAAKNILGRRVPYTDVPFFWSRHYDVTINYVGHAEKWDRIDIDGDLARHDATARFMRGDRALAVATISRDRESLEAEAGMEREARLQP